MKRGQVAIAAGLLLAWPAMAQAIVNDASAEMRQYVRARLADAAGMPDAAAASYARLLQASPQDKRLALRTYRQALTAGNYKLAGLAAAQLDRLGALPPTARCCCSPRRSPHMTGSGPMRRSGGSSVNRCSASSRR
ncbi:hypothetical protein ACFSTI_02300 [Rhizorhabdus histidinilytica]